MQGDVAAFGREIQDHISNWMETVPIKSITNRLCERKAESTGFAIDMTQNVFCAVSEPLALMSKGNVGAPLVQNGRLMGIFKELYPKQPEGYLPHKLNIFIFASYYKDFILDLRDNF
ncbi:PREDICTED: uncharacterized protein LOC105360122 [Ceratosolen solmsi marchali]|uniref:Uncharacterized protein LOC105360122 n=1 Tax=Ceratosolen solmsi marchali TaxID=326594 RepID=A0AAJ6YCJ3_9HYME|nr:PREDICTED: uncharacterized protein LOC105360122 [Ceratosolen solmsi marchali]